MYRQKTHTEKKMMQFLIINSDHHVSITYCASRPALGKQVFRTAHPCLKKNNGSSISLLIYALVLTRQFI